MPKKKSSAKSASKPKKQQDNKAKTTKDALDAFWAQKEAEKKTEKVVRSMRARVASKNGGPFFYLGGKRTLRSHEELAALSYNKGWHPNESVRDKRLGYGRYIRMWTLLPINSFWSDGIPAQSPSVLKLEYLDETIWQETPADSQRQLSKFGGGFNPELGRVLYEAIVRNDDFGELLDQFLDQQDGKRKVIIVKAPFMYEGDKVQQVHAASFYTRPVHHRCVDDEARSFRIGWIYNEFEEDPMWWDSPEAEKQASIDAWRLDRKAEFTKPGYLQSFGYIQGYVTAPFDWLRKIFGTVVYAQEGAVQWVLDASFVEDGDERVQRRKIVINIDTDVILPDNQPWPPQPGQETGMVTDYKRKRLKENVGNRHKFAVWPIGGHDFMAVRIIHQALQMYVEHSIPNEKSRAAYLDAIKCWPASPSVQAIIDATQMYLDDKEEYSIKFSLPSEGRHFVDGMSQSEIMDMLGYW